MQSKMARWWAAATLLVTLLAFTAAPTLASDRGWLGVTTQSTDGAMRRSLDLTRDGLLVNQVSDGSPADRAGVRKGDVILTYNSRGVTDAEDLRQLVRDTQPGREVSLGVWRDGQRRTLRVTVGDLDEADRAGSGNMFDTPEPPTPPSPPDAPRAPRAFGHGDSRGDDRGDPGDSNPGDTHRRVWVNGREVPQDEIDGTLKDMPDMGDMGDMKSLKDLKGLKDLRTLRDWPGPGGMMGMPGPARGRLGVRVEKLSDDLGQALGVEGDHGVLVTQVLEDTPAQRAGIRAGDVIVEVSGDNVDSPEELVKSLSSSEGSVDLTVLRRGAQRRIRADLGSRSDTAPEAPSFGRSGDRIRISEPGQGMRVYRMKTKDDSGGETEADLRDQIRQLKQEIEDLKAEMRDNKR
jgi:membrane-associated protease RseP (regulator of RpoE activity)